jgi:hypothetical protein
MNHARSFSLFTAVLLWATLIGGIMYSHMVFLSAYLHHLPESTSLVKGPYAIVDERFWKFFHPVLILSLVVSTFLNRRLKERRRYMMLAIGIYVLALVATFTYFVPELQAFADSAASDLTAAEWLARGKRWERLSWARGFFMYLGFVFLLIALTKTDAKILSMRRLQRRQRMVETS